MIPLLRSLRSPRVRPQFALTRPSAVVAFTWAMAVSALVYVLRFGSNCPVYDEWDMIPIVLEGRNVEFVTQYLNEHRFPLAKALWLATMAVSGFNFCAGMVTVVLIQSVSAFTLVAIARQLRGRSSIADVFLAVLLLHWGHHFNFLMAFQVAFALVVACGVGLLWLASRCEPGRELGTAAWASVLLLGVMLNGGFGLAAMPFAGLWVAYLGWRSDRRAFWLLVPAALAAVYLGVTLLNQPRTEILKVRPAWPDLLQAATDYFAVALGPWTYTLPNLSIPQYGLAAVFALAMVCGLRAARNPVERPRALGLLSVLAGHLLTTAGLVWTRGGAWSPHYVTVSGLGVAAAYLLLVRYGPTLGRTVPLAVAGIAVAVLLLNLRLGYREGMMQRGYYKELQADLKSGMPTPFVSGKFSGRYIVTPTSFLAMDKFRAAGLPSWQSARSMPTHKTLPLTFPRELPPWDEKGEAPVVTMPAPPGPVLGLRLRVDGRESVAWASWELVWTDAMSVRHRATAYPPVYRATDHAVMFWIDGPAADLQLRTLCPTPGYDVRSAEWLVPVSP